MKLSHQKERILIFQIMKCSIEIFNDFKPSICINTIAFTDVSKSEIFKDQPSLINNKAVNNLASACKKSKTKLVHFSTDYVFNGLKETPYIESDATNPLNFYGISKLRGEGSIRASGCEYLIIRTSWVFSEFRKNFLKTILDLTKHKKRNYCCVRSKRLPNLC